MAKKVLDFTTAAVTDGNQESFVATAADFANGASPMVAIGGLAGAETADLYIEAGSDWAPLGSGYQFVLAKSAYPLPGPGKYGLIKSITAGALEVWLHNGRN